MTYQLSNNEEENRANEEHVAFLDEMWQRIGDETFPICAQRDPDDVEEKKPKLPEPKPVEVIVIEDDTEEEVGERLPEKTVSAYPPYFDMLDLSEEYDSRFSGFDYYYNKSVKEAEEAEKKRAKKERRRENQRKRRAAKRLAGK